MGTGVEIFGVTADNSAEISKGNVEGSFALTISGDSLNLAAGVRGDLWHEGGILVYMPAADTMNYVSDDPADVCTMLVSGCLNGVTVSETRTLNGTTPVAGSQLFDVINFSFLVAGVTNVGKLTATSVTHGTVQISVAPDTGLSQHGFYRVPDGFNVIIRQVEIDCAKQGGGQDALVGFNLYVRFTSVSPWISILSRRIDTGVQNDVAIPYPLSAVLGAGADVRMSAISTQSSTEAYMRLVGERYAISPA